MSYSIHNYKALLESLCKLPKETSWVEFKENSFKEENIGKYISSLANSAMLDNEDYAYLVFGVNDTTHEVVGTTINISSKKVGNEDFLLWLQNRLNPKITVDHHSFDYEGKRIEMLRIEPGYIQPVKFNENAFIRIDANQQPLSKYPEKERTLWQITSGYSFENSFIKSALSSDELFEYFDINSLFEKLKNKTETKNNLISYIKKEELIRDDLQEKYEVHNLLAITCSNNFNKIPSLENKAARLIVYEGKNKLKAIHDEFEDSGYLISFKSLLSRVMSYIPSEEKVIDGKRIKIYSIPEISIREFLANALIHQDFTQKGGRPTVEVFADRIKITNPGEPLVDIQRFIDSPSRTRNPKFAKLMRDAGYCEERGSGVDRAISEIEKAALPPPLIEIVEGSTVVTAFMPRSFSEMNQEEKIRACFQHACLLHEAGDRMSNTSLRERFGLPQKHYPYASTVIKDCIDAKLIRPLNEEQGNRNARYVPSYIK